MKERAASDAAGPGQKIMIKRSLVTYVLISAFFLYGNGVRSASVAPPAGEHGMVVTAQHLASAVGADVLKNGGHAIDAAVAIGYALAVVYPAAGNFEIAVTRTCRD